MGIENLLQKSNNNFETAKWAEHKEFYDVSISRYYYCLYQKAIYIAIKKGFFTFSENGYDSHTKFIADFQKNVENRLTAKEVVWLAEFGALKKQRILSDYKLTCTTENQFKLGFIAKFRNINNILDKLAS